MSTGNQHGKSAREIEQEEFLLWPTKPTWETTLEDLLEATRTKLHEQGFTTRVEDDDISVMLSVRGDLELFSKKRNVVCDVLALLEESIKNYKRSNLTCRTMTRGVPKLSGVPNFDRKWRWVAAIEIEYSAQYPNYFQPIL